jgi:hypothetical protein
MDVEREQADLVRRMEPVRRVAARVLPVLGVLVAVYGAARWWYDARVFARMRETTCTLVSKQVELELHASGGRRRGQERAWYEYEGPLVFTHTVAGEEYQYTLHYRSREDPAPRFEEGKSYPCRYDPVKPTRVTLESSFAPDLEYFALGAALLALGFVMKFRWPR